MLSVLVDQVVMIDESKIVCLLRLGVLYCYTVVFCASLDIGHNVFYVTLITFEASFLYV